MPVKLESDSLWLLILATDDGVFQQTGWWVMEAVVVAMMAVVVAEHKLLVPGRSQTLPCTPLRSTPYLLRSSSILP